RRVRMRPLERKWDLAQRPHVDRSVPGPGPGTGRPPGIVDGATGQESGGAFPASGYPVDPAFPQLEVASDPARMLEIFRAQLKPVPGKACRILDCSPFRFRCRQSTTRCVLQYTLRVAEPSTGRQGDQWVTGLLYAEQGEAEERWRRLRSSRAVAPIPEPWQSFEAVGFIPELDMVVEVFPFDRRLPQLGRVLEAASRDLEPLLLA